MSNVPPDPNAKNSPQAVWSLVLGILSNTCLWILGSIPAIILGILAIKKIDQSQGRVTGRGLAIAGIVTGSVGVIVGLFVPITIMAVSTVPTVTKIQKKANIARQVSSVRQLMLGCRAWAADNDGKFPPNLEALLEEGYLDDPSLLMWAVSPGAPGEPYRYRAGLVDTGDPQTVVIAAPGAIDGEVIVGYLDGHVETVSEVEFQWPE